MKLCKSVFVEKVLKKVIFQSEFTELFWDVDKAVFWIGDQTVKVT